MRRIRSLLAALAFAALAGAAGAQTIINPPAGAITGAETFRATQAGKPVTLNLGAVETATQVVMRAAANTYTARQTVNAALRLSPGTVAGLATMDPSPLDGDRGYVTDAVSCSGASAVAGSGSLHCAVYYNGSAWIAEAGIGVSGLLAQANTWSALNGFGGGLFQIGATDTSFASAGLIRVSDPSWSPSGTTSQFNNYDLKQITTSLTGGSVVQRWADSNNINVCAVTTTGPAGSPGSPSGMADSHSVCWEGVELIPAGLCDGLGGSGFSGGGGAPGNNCYQEIGGLENTATVLSPGHYAEGVGSAIMDNNGGAGVPIRGNAFLAAIGKASATNTYPLYAYYANSFGSQQSTNAPDAGFHIDGGWRIGIDLNGTNLYSGMVAINLPGGQQINADSSNEYFGINGVTRLQVDAAGIVVIGAVQPSSTGGIIGTATNNSASAGSVGEYVTATTLTTSLTSLTVVNAASASLTAGDWDVECVAGFNPAGSTTSSAFWSGVSTTSGVLGAFGTVSVLEMASQTGLPERLASPPVRLSLASTTTAFCVAEASFGVSTMTVDGFLRARRVR